MKKLASLGCASILALAIVSGGTSFAAGEIEVIVNNNAGGQGTSAYLANGTTMVPLNVVRQIPGISVSWDNKTKTVTVMKGSKMISLVAGQKTAFADSGKITLSMPATLEKGRIMVPLRFIAEVSGAYVTWNSYSRTVYVAKADNRLMERLASGNLTDARRAVMQLPRVSKIRNLEPTPSSLEGQSFTYYFPEGEYKRFLIGGGDVVSYYEVVNERSQLIWTARLTGGAKTDSVLFFKETKAIEESGVRPILKSRLAYFHVMPHIGAASYGFIGPDGTVTELGTKDVTMNEEVVDIPEEQK
ncbi:Copper amine oxidase N-terminal domain-containing protein [Paenibacillus sophorae]|uniref:Copper amine oxidase N-terminal domain-containing protein n=1 Tax=Paenibacillus sophorae TaxID=1333845 RepID=A0A1H8KW17_9BACL|nr:copper amine oxidase N-terminal domain-containing protein [Paenibacillus sophorae]QWU17544.1 copper amine oxidase N-terminal domain-containing protein [Paenibacillus sophorae]SEN97049.1 Copper amine oxidase N-terminal domain-containing protein [Paenibacillus sophorae]